MINQDIKTKIDKSTELLEEARSFYESSDYDESERCANEVLTLLDNETERNDLGEELDIKSQKNAVLELLAHAYNRFATISFSRGDYTLTLSHAETGIVFCERIGALYRKAGLITIIGGVYSNLSDYGKAIDYYQKSLAMNEELGRKGGMAYNLGNIGNVYRNLSEYDKALEYHHKALAIDEELGMKAGIARHLNNIGNVYAELSDYAKALEYCQKSLAMNEELESKQGVSINLGIIGLLYAEQKFEAYDAEKAEEYLLKAIAINEVIGDKYHLYWTHKRLADLYEYQDRWKESHVHFKKYHNLEKEVQSDEAKKKAELIEQQNLLLIERSHAKATADILHKVLPSSIADRLIKGEKVADYFTSVSILFADIVGFTPIASKMPARKVLAFLNYVFGEFDRIIESHGCEKIKTIGDGYMAVAGAPIECPDHAERITRAALEMMGDIQLPEDIRSSLPKGAIFNIRIGINIGPAFGGIVGENRFVYDIYSDSVNTAARMESHGEPGKIHVSEEFAFHLQNRMDMVGDDLGGIVFEERGEMEIKGKGKMKTYFLEQNNTIIQ